MATGGALFAVAMYVITTMHVQGGCGSSNACAVTMTQVCAHEMASIVYVSETN